MAITFLNNEQLKKLESDEVEHFYEYLDKAGPRSINGMPMFFSMHYLTKTELEVIRPLVDQLKEQKESFLANKPL